MPHSFLKDECAQGLVGVWCMKAGRRAQEREEMEDRMNVRVDR